MNENLLYHFDLFCSKSKEGNLSNFIRRNKDNTVLCKHAKTEKSAAD
jgi:hypothetical protein